MKVLVKIVQVLVQGALTGLYAIFMISRNQKTGKEPTCSKPKCYKEE